jgi:hypothetical protein
MAASRHTVNDFKIGESVVPVNKSELTLVIVDILKDKKKLSVNHQQKSKVWYMTIILKN